LGSFFAGVQLCFHSVTLISPVRFEQKKFPGVNSVSETGASDSEPALRTLPAYGLYNSVVKEQAAGALRRSGSIKSRESDKARTRGWTGYSENCVILTARHRGTPRESPDPRQPPEGSPNPDPTRRDEFLDGIELADVPKARAINQNRQWIVGMKARLSRNIAAITTSNCYGWPSKPRVHPVFSS
jgi:hypothetical protein